MKRKDLEALGLEKEVIDKIMNLHQTDTEENKKVLSEKDQEITNLKDFETKYKEAQSQITALNEQLENKEGLSQEEVNTKLDELRNDYENKLTQKDEAFATEKLFNGYEFSSDYAKKGIMADFKEKGLKFEEGKFLGADDFFKSIKETQPTAFKNEVETKPTGTFKTGKEHEGEVVDELEAQMDAVLGLGKEE